MYLLSSTCYRNRIMHVLLLHKCIRTLPCCCCYYKQSVANTGSSIKNRRIHGLMVPCSHTENFFANLSSSVFKELTTVQGFSSSMTLHNRFEWLIISNKLAKKKIRQRIVKSMSILNDTIRWKKSYLFCCKICRNIYFFSL